jgi:hypothetical protein
VEFGGLELDNMNFVYRREKFAGLTAPQINFDDIVVRKASGRFSGIRIDADTIHFTTHGLSASEQSGFVLSSLDCSAKVSERGLSCRNVELVTPRSHVKTDFDFSYADWEDYQDFINKVRIDGSVSDSSYVDFRDIAAFTSELNGLQALVTFSGKVKGTVTELSLRSFKLAYGRDTRFAGNADLSGLPDFKSSFLHFDAKELSTSYADLVTLPDYPFDRGEKIQLPSMLARLGRVSYRGKFDGFITDFTTYGRFTTALGNVSTRLSVQAGEKDEVRYQGRIAAEGFDLGRLLGQKDFNKLVFEGEVKGRGLGISTLDAQMEGRVSSLNYNGYTYRDIIVNGTVNEKIFNGLVVSRDPNADFDFNGTIDFNRKVPEMDFISTINRLRLRELGFTNRADSGMLSSQILINIRGDNIDNLSGQVHFDNTVYKTTSKIYKLSTLNVQLDQQEPEKKINLSSAYLNAFVHGSFNLTNLEPAFKQFLFHYYPTFFKKPVSQKRFTDALDFRIIVKKFNTINELFVPDVMFSPNTIVEGNFDAGENKLNLQMTSSKASYKSIVANELVFIINESQNTVLAEASGKSLALSDSIHMENFNFSVNSIDKNSRYHFDWDNLHTPRHRGEIVGSVAFDKDNFRLTNEKLLVYVNDSAWQQSRSASLVIDKSGSIEVDSLAITSSGQHISARGRISDAAEDSLMIRVDNLGLTQFNPLLRMVKLDLKGVMNGNITLSNPKKNFIFRGDLGLSGLVVNTNTIGELSVKTAYSAGDKKISLDGYTSLGITDASGAQVKNITFTGSYYPSRKDESLDIDFSASPANLKILNPYLEGIMTINDAFVNGSGKIHGTPANILIDGKFRLWNSEVRVDYTNVTYRATGDIEVMPDQIRFSDILLREKGTKAAPQGTVNGNIFHRNFDRMQLDYDITYRRMLVMNTTEKDNSTFYGKIYGTGNVGIYGFISDLHMVVVDTTTRGSRFILPLDGPAEIGENDFIHFVKKDTVKTKKNSTLTGFSLDMSIHATPEAQAQIILDKQHGDMLSVQGQGDLNLRINTLGKFEMFGDYIITDGDYLFTLENVINKKFDIEAGSSISWSGNPYNAEIDVVTSYKQRASIAPLLDDSTAKGRYPVDCRLLITGKLFSPNIRFAIDFPNLDATSKARIASVLSDEAELNRQVFSFLLFRTFLKPQIYSHGGGGVSAGGAAASTGSEMLSNRVSEFLNTYFGNLTGIGDLQLGLNYRPGSQGNSEAVDLALSKQFLNNKITVDGNFGVNNTTQSRNTGGLIGDVNIDYKLSEDGRYRLKGFNRSNDITQVTTAGGPYTQGIGFFYREEFETLDQLFRRYQKKMRKAPKQPSAKKSDDPNFNGQP